MTDIKQHIIPLGPVLVIMIGPDGAGKQALAMDKFEDREIIYPDVIRSQLFDGQIRFDKDQLVFDEIDHMVESRLRAGGRVVVCDTTNLKGKLRLALKAIGDKYCAKIVYLVADRDLAVKTCNSSGGMPHPRGLDMIQITHDIFQRYESTIISGDGNGSVMVVDHRKENIKVIKPLSRTHPLIDLDQRGYKQVRVIPDVHGNLEGLVSILGTVSPDMFLVFLGDITDYGKESWQCVRLIHELVITGRAIMVRGNHDRKMARFIDQRLNGEGFSGQISHGMQMTVDQWDHQSARSQFINGHNFLTLVDLSPDWVQLNHWMFAHAAISHTMINNPQFRANKASTTETLALYGETDGTVDDDGKPVRTYNWIERIPDDYSVVVGHQIMSVEAPVVRGTPAGDKVVFLDTGSSKYVDDTAGFLSYCDFDIHKRGSFDWSVDLQIHKEFGHE